MIVASNTSPLTNLAAIGQFDILHDLFDRLYIPPAVWAELNTSGERWPGRNEVAAADWVVQKDVQNESLVHTLQRDLDEGEAEAIALAIELKSDLLLLDEVEGRAVADHLNLRIVGAVGILLAAKKQGIIPFVHPHLNALRETGFYLGERSYQFAP